MMFGMSYKNSETKPQDKSFGQIIIIALFLDGVISTVLVPTPLVTWAFVISGGNVPPPPLE
jgi:hypothetical protein